MESAGLEKQGTILKKGAVIPAWNRRWMQADPMNLRLKYYKDRPDNPDKPPRGEFILTDCTVSLDRSCAEDEYRFLITSADQRKTYHLEVEDEYEMNEWIRVIQLISDLGVTKRAISEDQKVNDNDQAFRLAVEKLLENIERQASSSREFLTNEAEQKWKAKCRLIELKDEMEEKRRKLRAKQEEMKVQEKDYRDQLSHLNQALYVLQQQVRKSNEVQQAILDIFNKEIPLAEKARKSVQLCRRLLQGHRPQMVRQTSDDGVSPDVDRRKVRARSHSDLTVPRAAEFEDEMMKILLETFPETLQPQETSSERKEMENSATTGFPSDDIGMRFQLYHRYYTEVHLPREMELIKIRTKCQQKYNSLRYVKNKMELARREEDEIDWIMTEMTRAIDRLNKEGVPRAPNEDQANPRRNRDLQNPNGGAYEPPGRRSSEIVPVLAHRATWSESSDTIFQLNSSRHEQYKRTKDLEDALKAREIVRSWYEDKYIPTHDS